MVDVACDDGADSVLAGCCPPKLRDARNILTSCLCFSPADTVGGCTSKHSRYCIVDRRWRRRMRYRGDIH